MVNGELCVMQYRVLLLKGIYLLPFLFWVLSFQYLPPPSYPYLLLLRHNHHNGILKNGIPHLGEKAFFYLQSLLNDMENRRKGTVINIFPQGVAVFYGDELSVYAGVLFPERNFQAQ